MAHRRMSICPTTPIWEYELCFVWEWSLISLISQIFFVINDLSHGMWVLRVPGPFHSERSRIDRYDHVSGVNEYEGVATPRKPTPRAISEISRASVNSRR